MLWTVSAGLNFIHDHDMDIFTKKILHLIEHEADSINRKHWITSVISKYRTSRFSITK